MCQNEQQRSVSLPQMYSQLPTPARAGFGRVRTFLCVFQGEKIFPLFFGAALWKQLWNYFSYPANQKAAYMCDEIGGKTKSLEDFTKCIFLQK